MPPPALCLLGRCAGRCASILALVASPRRRHQRNNSRAVSIAAVAPAVAVGSLGVGSAGAGGPRGLRLGERSVACGRRDRGSDRGEGSPREESLCLVDIAPSGRGVVGRPSAPSSSLASLFTAVSTRAVLEWLVVWDLIVEVGERVLARVGKACDTRVGTLGDAHVVSEDAFAGPGHSGSLARLPEGPQPAPEGFRGLSEVLPATRKHVGESSDGSRSAPMPCPQVNHASGGSQSHVAGGSLKIPPSRPRRDGSRERAHALARRSWHWQHQLTGVRLGRGWRWVQRTLTATAKRALDALTRAPKGYALAPEMRGLSPPSLQTCASSSMRGPTRLCSSSCCCLGFTSALVPLPLPGLVLNDFHGVDRRRLTRARRHRHHRADEGPRYQP